MYSKKNARPTGEEAAAEDREQEVERLVRADWAQRHFGLVHDADVARLELAPTRRFPSGPLHQVVEHLAVDGGVARSDAVFDPLAAERHRLGLLLLQGGHQALFLR